MAAKTPIIIVSSTSSQREEGARSTARAGVAARRQDARMTTGTSSADQRRSCTSAMPSTPSGEVDAERRDPVVALVSWNARRRCRRRRHQDERSTTSLTSETPAPTAGERVAASRGHAAAPTAATTAEQAVSQGS